MNDPSTPITLIFVGIIVVVIVAWLYSFAAHQKRREAMRGLAVRLGFVFIEEASVGADLFSWLGLTDQHPLAQFVNELESFRPFGTGSSRRINNMLYGSRNGLDWAIFDYRYTVQSGKHSHTYYHSIVLARAPLAFPYLSIDQENFFSRVGSMVGLKDLQFESEEFNRRFKVHCNLRERAYEILHPRAMEYLMNLPDLSWQLGGPYLLIDVSRHISPEQALALMGAIEGFIELVPEFVKEDYALRAHHGGLPWTR